MIDTDIQLVCFDLGGVFVRLCGSWSGATTRAGIAAKLNDEQLARNRFFVDVNHRYERGQLDENTYADHIADLVHLTPTQVLAVLRAWLVEPYPGVDAMLDRLDAARVKTACLSNTNHTHWEAMTCAGPLHLPLHRLHHRFASPFIGHRKPDAAAYRHVQSTTGIPPESILFFDDAAENVGAAAHEGWQAYRIDPHGDPIAQVIDHLQHHQVL